MTISYHEASVTSVSSACTHSELRHTHHPCCEHTHADTPRTLTHPPCTLTSHMLTPTHVFSLAHTDTSPTHISYTHVLTQAHACYHTQVSLSPCIHSLPQHFACTQPPCHPPCPHNSCDGRWGSSHLIPSLLLRQCQTCLLKQQQKKKRQWNGGPLFPANIQHIRRQCSGAEKPNSFLLINQHLLMKHDKLSLSLPIR